MLRVNSSLLFIVFMILACTWALTNLLVYEIPIPREVVHVFPTTYVILYGHLPEPQSYHYETPFPYIMAAITSIVSKINYRHIYPILASICVKIIALSIYIYVKRIATNYGFRLTKKSGILLSLVAFETFSLMNSALLNYARFIYAVALFMLVYTFIIVRYSYSNTNDVVKGLIIIFLLIKSITLGDAVYVAYLITVLVSLVVVKNIMAYIRRDSSLENELSKSCKFSIYFSMIMLVIWIVYIMNVVGTISFIRTLLSKMGSNREYLSLSISVGEYGVGFLIANLLRKLSNAVLTILLSLLFVRDLLLTFRKKIVGELNILRIGISASALIIVVSVFLLRAYRFIHTLLIPLALVMYLLKKTKGKDIKEYLMLALIMLVIVINLILLYLSIFRSSLYIGFNYYEVEVYHFINDYMDGGITKIYLVTRKVISFKGLELFLPKIPIIVKYSYDYIRKVLVNTYAHKVLDVGYLFVKTMNDELLVHSY